MARPDSSDDVTLLLRAWADGDSAALEQLLPVVYGSLRRIARAQMSQERGGTLQPTALVNEAFLRLIGATSISWQDRAHFFAVCSTMMRRVLVDAARRRQAEKRGGGDIEVDLAEGLEPAVHKGRELIALDDALEALARIDPRKARVVELKFFGGLNVKEASEVLKVSPRTVMRDWNLARAWLLRELAS
jgi:RNA polymerase sigma factor (TIGR02999 family)